jgi:hypothetical protein
VNRPDLERFRRFAAGGIGLSIQQAQDMLDIIDYALSLESALHSMIEQTLHSMIELTPGTQDASAGSHDSAPEATKK